MLQLASARVPEADLIEGDAADLPFAAEQFDAVTVGFGIPHVPDAPAVFSEVRRVLKPGGRFAYSVWAEGEGAMCYVFEAIAAHGAEGIALPPGPGVHDYADTDRAQRALADAGFVAFHIAQVDSHWTVTDPGSPYDFFKDGTVRGGALLRVQPPANAQAIRHAVAERVAMAHGAGPRWDVPIPSVVVSAVAP
jgi:SAM-dependent methyltransferase